MIVLFDKMDVLGEVEAADSSLLLVLFSSRLTCKRVVVHIRHYSSCLVLSYLPDVCMSNLCLSWTLACILSMQYPHKPARLLKCIPNLNLHLSVNDTLN